MTIVNSKPRGKNKICTACGIEKPISEFYKKKQNSSGYNTRCKDCMRKCSKKYYNKRLSENPNFAKERTVQFRETHPLYERNRNLLKYYNIDINQYNKMLADQEYKCKICQLNQLDINKPLHVDHDHTTGEIRGLLCHYCNTAIGLFKEDPIILNNAIKYINDFKQEQKRA